MKTFQVTLPDESARWIDEVLKTPHGPDADSLFLAAVTSLQDRFSRDGEWSEQELRNALEPAIQSLDRGEGVSGDALMDRLKARLREAA